MFVPLDVSADMESRLSRHIELTVVISCPILELSQSLLAPFGGISSSHLMGAMLPKDGGDVHSGVKKLSFNRSRENCPIDVLSACEIIVNTIESRKELERRVVGIHRGSQLSRRWSTS